MRPPLKTGENVEERPPGVRDHRLERFNEAPAEDGGKHASEQ